MKNTSKVFKIKIKNIAFRVTLSNSYIAENTYRHQDYEPEIRESHFHIGYELFIIEDEPINVFFDSAVHRLQNCVLIIPPFANHYTVRSGGYRIAFSYKTSVDSKENTNPPFNIDSDKLLVLSCDKELIEHAKRIENHFFRMRKYSHEIIESTLKLIFCEIMTLCNECETGEHITYEESYFEKIENLLYDFRSDINLGVVAKELNVSTKHASRIIRKNYNTTLSKMLCERRLDAASDLLLYTNMSISQIVERVNFPSESYFYSKFKERYKQTPNHYRKMKKDN